MGELKYSRVRIITIFWESQMDYKPKIDFNRTCTGMPALVGWRRSLLPLASTLLSSKAVPHKDGPGRLKCVSGPSLNACWCIRARKVVPWDGVRCHSIYLSNQSLELDKILQMFDLKILIIVTLWTVSFSSIKSHSQDSGVASLPLGGVLTPSDGTIQGWHTDQKYFWSVGWQRMLARTARYNSSSRRMMFVVIKTW